MSLKNTYIQKKKFHYINKTRERKEAAVYVLVSRLLVTHHVISVTKCGEESGGGVIKTDTTAPKYRTRASHMT